MHLWPWKTFQTCIIFVWQERRKKERAEEEARLAEQRQAEEAERKAAEVSHLYLEFSRNIWRSPILTYDSALL